MRKKLLFLVNPHAGKSAIKGHLLSIVDAFIKGGFDVNLHVSQDSGDIKRVAKSRCGDYDLVVCSGGDGTMSELVNGVMDCPRKPVLGYIPAGTTNDFSSNFLLPKNMVDAAQVIVKGIPTYFDIGKINDKYFSYVAAFGAFTEVTYQAPQEIKSIFGRMGYFLEGVGHLADVRSYNIRLEHDNGVIEDDILVGLITNSSYVGGVYLGPLIDSSMSDGLMEVLLVRRPKNLLALTPSVSALLSGEIDPDNVYLIKTRSLRIISQDEIAWNLDGDFGGTARDTLIENCRSALRLVVPEEAIST